MIPHEKALVERLKNEPFALIGINTDPDKAEFRKQAAASGVTWRSAWDGSTRGPLCTAWGVKSFPTVYVLDAKGTIRHTGLRGRQLEEAVEALIREAKSPGADPAGDGSRDPKDAKAPKVPEDSERSRPGAGSGEAARDDSSAQAHASMTSAVPRANRGPSIP